MENKIEDILVLIWTDYRGFYSGYLIWRIPEESKQMNKVKPSGLNSPPFYTKLDGYKMFLIGYLNDDDVSKGSHLSVWFAIIRGEYNPILKWSFVATVTITLLNQNKNTAQ